MPNKAISKSSITIAAPEDFEAAFNLVLPDIEAVPTSELSHIGLDLHTTVTTVCGVIPELEELRESAQQLPHFDASLFDKLRNYALAAAHAHALHRTALQERDQVRELAEESMAVRDLLKADLEVLTMRRLVGSTALREVKGGRTYKHIAPDIQILIQVFRQNWGSVEGKCGTTADELARASKLATRFVDALGGREQGPAHVDQTGELRLRAFHLMVRTYDQVRRAVSFLRWDQGDADLITPSLYAGRTGGRRKEDVTPTPAPVVPLPATAMPSGTNGAAPAQPVGHATG